MTKRFAMLMLLGAGCGHAADKPAAGSGSSTTDPWGAKPPTPPPTLMLTAKIELKDAGAEPKHVLAYKPKVHVRELCFTQSMVDTDATKPETKKMLEANKNTLCVTWKNTPADPFAHTFKIKSVYVGAAHLGEDQMSAGEKAVVGSIEKTIVASPEGTAKTDAQGRIALDAPGVATQPSAPSLLWAYAIPFPAEPIGVGATWHVRDVVPVENTPTDADYTLVSFTDGRAVVRWKRAATTQNASMESDGEATVALDDVEAISASENDVMKLELGGPADQAPVMKMHVTLE